LEKVGKQLLRKALDRNLDGKDDRLVSVALTLLGDRRTRQVGKGMLDGMLNDDKTAPDTMSVAAPTEAIAMVAESQWPARRATLLWNQLPEAARFRIFFKLLMYALMNENAAWTRASHVIFAKGHFEASALQRMCLVTATQLIPIHGKLVPDTAWTSAAERQALQWMLVHIITALEQETDPDAVSSRMTCANWLLQRGDKDALALPLSTANFLHGQDTQALPLLGELAVEVRRAHLSQQVWARRRPQQVDHEQLL
jgi:hypothetical protein